MVPWGLFLSLRVDKLSLLVYFISKFVQNKLCFLLALTIDWIIKLNYYAFHVIFFQLSLSLFLFSPSYSKLLAWSALSDLVSRDSNVKECNLDFPTCLWRLLFVCKDWYVRIATWICHPLVLAVAPRAFAHALFIQLQASGHLVHLSQAWKYIYIYIYHRQHSGFQAMSGWVKLEAVVSCFQFSAAAARSTPNTEIYLTR